MATRWGQRKEFTRGRKVEDVKEDLVPLSSVRARVGESTVRPGMTYFIWQGEDTLVVAFTVRHHDAQETHNNILMK